MAKINDVYDIGAAFEAIEDELTASMIRNMKRHKAEEAKEGYEWAQWQAEQGIAELEEPGVNQAAGSFQVKLKGGDADEGQGGEAAVPDEPEGISGNAGAGQ